MRILYFYDALCGWCYGFSPTIQQFVLDHLDDFEVEVISGGMVTGDRIVPIGDMAPYISSAFKTVEDRTGVKFGDKFINKTLAEGTAIFSSLPPAYALSAFKSLLPQTQLEYAAGIQKLIYFDGIHPEHSDEYVTLAKQLGADSSEMLVRMDAEEYQQQAKSEFQYAQQLGITGFPTTVLEKDEKLFILGRGAVDLETLEANYLEAVNNR